MGLVFLLTLGYAKALLVCLLMLPEVICSSVKVLFDI